MRNLVFVLTIGVVGAMAACGDDSGNKTVDGSVIDAPPDTPNTAADFTSFVKGIVTSTTEGSTVAIPLAAPHPFSDFSEATLMDNDQNNQTAYASLFM